jgi:hypothetical protein
MKGPKMNNLECAVRVLAMHREARKWSDEAVAADMLAQLGLEVDGDAAHASPVINPSSITEGEVVAAEVAARDAVDRAKAARAALDAQTDQERHVNDEPARDDAARTAAYRDQLDAALPTPPAEVPPGEYVDHEQAPPHE